MHLEKITENKGNRDGYMLLFENDVKVKCYTENVADFCLHGDMELDEATYDRLIAAVSFSRTRRRAAAVISVKAVSEGELKARLVEKGESEEDAAAAVERLARAGALNDAEYAAAVVRHYAQKGYGRVRIKSEFYKRKIPRGLWEDALAEMPDTSESIDVYLASRLNGRETDKKLIKKVSDALCRRGFSWEEINEAIRRYCDTAATED